MENNKIKEKADRMAENLVASLKSRTPILKNPDRLTADIMNAIHINPERDKPEIMKKTGEIRSLVILRRLLAAASVCLLMVFAYEEYSVVEKISRLEKQSSALSGSAQYQAALNLKKVMNVITLNPQIINQYLELKSKKNDPRTILKAAMIADAGGFYPDAFKLMNKAAYNLTNKDIILFINNFDSIHHIRQR